VLITLVVGEENIAFKLSAVEAEATTATSV